MKTLFLIPFYNHPEKIKALCEALARYNLHILIVDDGSNEASKKALLNLSEFGEFNELKKALMDATGLKGKGFFMPLRILLTGAEHGPELSELYPLIKPYLKEILR